MEEASSEGSIPSTRPREKLSKEAEKKTNYTPLKGKLSRRDLLKVAAASAGGLALRKYLTEQERSNELTERYSDPLANVIQAIKRQFPEAADWRADSPKWSGAIKKGFAKAGLSTSAENTGVVLTIINALSGFREDPPVFGELPIIRENHLSLLKKQWTGGPMEVNYQFVMDLESISEEEALKRLSSIDDGVYYGIAMLKKISVYYQNIPDEARRLECIFADWNAGEGRSVRAGLQAAVAELSKLPVNNTGLLLLEDVESKKIPVVEAIMTFPDAFGLSREQILTDLNEPTDNIRTTATWQAVESKLGHQIEPVPADLQVPGLIGKLKNLFYNEGTSLGFARNRLQEYKVIRKIMKT
ncbi:hypothetical protein A3C98_05400 [Candidatus Roizmanbacteria bacterium RIFCSPHIGHO2_02_FULL_37_15]|uniref:Uncharacterized protein n=1 Tax=Candidatus Roizmanbacteria bacterium RIFCSPLOWO2_01_FULL_37_16 TaxID=1802058 RepID=A0A1F7ILX2_9BACT|nr:MAG: hypothetical protein A2859_04055 [Candidatus Roizmanbacteria bacterium RIFCSPHIGHO2_01_FULL_37_16b]OGK22365.1 MAG: hypothetical protein A3C98_05400 [Candidatus Roizmanbacteria bacterium RIFCSPHIGHO2_02_FULL_37_15]OGK33206.1 MAG: hypothetical protein A3F57_05060 [Candidatus Roizmanbacteria bacterium RIFCSPHIGHO2_12_FULL_36_11]OGK44384.1 MAG: hypothetical protein A3B40_04675 [Candidatus Roizmanbacteria bacterium RIFCSPLOWO2_01_FULL_37_16]